jgi:hypothetical protein
MIRTVTYEGHARAQDPGIAIRIRFLVELCAVINADQNSEHGYLWG